MKSTSSVIVIYECAETRETAVAFCDRLVERFWARFGFEVSWVPYEKLADKASASEAAASAAGADLVVFAHTHNQEPPLSVKRWIESWLKERGEKEGTLVALSTPPPPEGTCPVSQSYFRRLAHRAGMDFAAELPINIASLAESTESVATRASEVTSVLDSILHQHHPPGL
ncbi:MAG TPA: hypothetical protein VJA21_06595 [Verrucomicrobiae bacterium]